MTVLAAIDLLTLHMVDGRVVQANPAQITQLIHPRAPGKPNKQLPDKVQCLVRFADGTYLSVVEDCEAVRDAMKKAP